MSLRRLSLSLFAVAACAAPLAAAESDKPTPEFVADKAQLDDMLAKRQFDLFELAFTPVKLDRIAFRDRRGQDWVYNYLVFTIRNQATIDPAKLATRAKGYNEVLQAMAQEYEMAKVTDEGGVKLVIDGVQGQDGVVLERTEAKLRTRTVRLNAIASTENGTRIRLLDEPPGSGPQEQYAFPDLGEPTSAQTVKAVIERIEAQEGRRLLSASELTSYELPPFDGVARVDAPDITSPAHDTHGWFIGEAHGVIVFPRLSDHGDRFSIQLNGLCNKLRFRIPEPEAGKPENYFQARVLRRTMVVEFTRPGDEFSRHQDRFVLGNWGYRWVDTFQRVDTRRTSAYARYFLDNVADEKGAPNAAIQAEFWPFYEQLRAQYGEKLPALQPEKP